MELSIVRSLPCIVTSPSPSEVPAPPPVTAVFPIRDATASRLTELNESEFFSEHARRNMVNQHFVLRLTLHVVVCMVDFYLNLLINTPLLTVCRNCHMLADFSDTEDQSMTTELVTKMYTSLKGRPVLGRIFQGKEPSQFGAIFQPMVVLKGGLCSGYKYIADKGLNDETYTTESLALIQISGTFMHNNKAVQVDLSTYEQQQLAANMAEFLKVRILLKNFVCKGVFSILSCLQWPLVFIAEVDRHGCIFGWILS
nr:villin-3-like [Ipomoea trifida]